MTLAEIEASDRDVLTPQDICEVLRCDAYSITRMARAQPQMLGFPVCVVAGANRSTVKIPRIPFIDFIKGRQ